MSGEAVVGVVVLCNHRGMSRRRDRTADRKAAKQAAKDAKVARKQAEKDLRHAGTAARKAFDLKDPRFLGEAAVAATRGPMGLALFGASRGLQVAREKRAENAEVLDSLAADARQHAETVKEKASITAAPPAKKRGPLRRFAPLMVVGLAGGAAVAGAAAYFLREQPAPASSSSPTPAPRPTPADDPAPVDTADPEGPADQSTSTTTPAAAEPAPSGSGPGSDSSSGSGSGSDPAGETTETPHSAPAAGSATPGAAAGSAPQPEDAVDGEERDS